MYYPVLYINRQLSRLLGIRSRFRQANVFNAFFVSHGGSRNRVVWCAATTITVIATTTNEIYWW